MGLLLHVFRAFSRVDAKKLLTCDFVHNMLHEKVKMGKVVKNVSVKLVETCGDGKASTTDRTHVEVEFGVLTKEGAIIDGDTYYLVLEGRFVTWYMRLGSSIPQLNFARNWANGFLRSTNLFTIA